MEGISTLWPISELRSNHHGSDHTPFRIGSGGSSIARAGSHLAHEGPPGSVLTFYTAACCFPPFGAMSVKSEDRPLRPPLRHGSIAWVESANFRAAASRLNLKFAIEMVCVWPLRLIFPSHFSSRQLARKQDLAIAGPSRQGDQVGPKAVVARLEAE